MRRVLRAAQQMQTCFRNRTAMQTRTVIIQYNMPVNGAYDAFQGLSMRYVVLRLSLVTTCSLHVRDKAVLLNFGMPNNRRPHWQGSTHWGQVLNSRGAHAGQMRGCDCSCRTLSRFGARDRWCSLRGPASATPPPPAAAATPPTRFSSGHAHAHTHDQACTMERSRNVRFFTGAGFLQSPFWQFIGGARSDLLSYK